MNKGQKASLRLSDRRADVGNTKQVPFADWKHVPVLGAGAVCQLIRAVSGGVISRYRRSATAINFGTANSWAKMECSATENKTAPRDLIFMLASRKVKLDYINKDNFT